MNRKKIFILSLFFLLFFSIISFCIYNNYRNNNNITTEEIISEENQDKEIPTKTYMNNKIVFDVFSLKTNKNGELQKNKITFLNKGIDTYKDLINYIFDNELKNNKIIYVPNDTKVINVKVWNETLIVNFNDSANNIKTKDENEEKKILKLIINSILCNKNKEFTDVQFYINNKPVDRFFGYIDTKNPFINIIK